MKPLATTGMVLCASLVATGGEACGGSEFLLVDAGPDGSDASSSGSGSSGAGSSSGTSGASSSGGGLDAGGCRLSTDCHGPLPGVCQLCPDGSNGCAHWECRAGNCVIGYCSAADAGCAQAGTSCLSTACCGRLSCCSGVPFSGGQATCLVSCPISDWHMKAGFTPVANDAVLDAVTSLPLSKWHYQSEPPDVQHIGPMAQDFKALFGVGADDKHIFQIDADGVSFAAIQALAHKLDVVMASQESLERENAELRARLQQIERRATATPESCSAASPP